MEKDVTKLRCCGFCGKNENEIHKLITGPQTFICDECVSLCVGVIHAADGSFLHRVKSEIKDDKRLKGEYMKRIDAPDGFWELLEEGDILESMAVGILRKSDDLSDHIYERAKQIMVKAKKADKLAWAMVHEANPELEGKQMTASWALRLINVYDI